MVKGISQADLQLRAPILLACLVIAGCSLSPRIPPPVITPDCHAIDVPVSRTDVLAAMLSVHQAAYCATREGRHAPVCVSKLVWPLSRAALLLRCDPDPVADTRRKRAIAKLAAYGWENQRFDDELALLGLDIRELHGLVPARPTTLEAASFSLPAWREWVIAMALAKYHHLILDITDDACDFQPEVPYVTPRIGDGTISVTTDVYVSVKRNAQSVKRNVDPQRWDECGKFWPAPPPQSTYLATVNSPDCPLSMSEISVGTPPPNPGDNYWGRRVFENFQCKTSGCSTDFKNVLLADSYDASAVSIPVLPGDAPKVIATHVMSYSLPKCGFNYIDGFIEGTIAGMSNNRLTIDQGRIDVWQEKQRTHVLAHKEFSFVLPFNNQTAAAVLGFAVAELNQELADLACCAKASTP